MSSISSPDDAGSGWTRANSTYELAEFLAAVSSCGDANSAMQRGAERAAEALDADIAAVVGAQALIAAFGIADEPDLERAIRAISAGSVTVEAGDFGPCTGISVPLDTPSAARLVVAKLDTTPFQPEESGLVRAMGRVLSLTLGLLESLESERRLRIESEQHAADNARLAASVERRRRMLESASEIEHAISRHAPLQEVLNAVIEAAHDLLGADAAALWLRDPEDPDHMLMPSSIGLEADVLNEVKRMKIGEGAGGQAVSQNRLVVLDDYRNSRTAIGAVASAGVTSAMAAPVHENGALVGSLVVGSRTPGYVFGLEQQEILLAFAEHASLALTGAQAIERINEALHDALTGLPNRTLLLDRIEAAIQSSGPGHGAVVLFVDLDRFKLVNDSFGHSYGDRLLVAVAERLRSLLRAGDTLARLGGDEFVVLLDSGAAMETAIEVAGRLLEALREPFTIDGRQLFIGASIGIASGSGEPAELVARADLAMYRAKRDGSSRFAVFESTMRAAAVERLELEAALQNALANREFLLEYQPIVALVSGEVVGFEALLRWRTAGRGIVPPAAFIPLAEESGLIVPIGSWVIDEACRQLAAWRARHGERRVTISINLSGAQLASNELVDDVADTLARHWLRPRDVTLEITESVLLADTDSRLARLAELRRLGVRLAIDDFGTGYSSLGYIRQLDVDILKIARPLVDGVAEQAKDRAVARAIVELARNLGLMLVAEGIERPEQNAALRRLGCSHGQGFYFAPALDVDAAGALLDGASGERVFLPWMPRPDIPGRAA